jgi:hypothetical protein
MDKKKEHLPLHMDRDSSPPLFKALDGLEGSPKELCQFFLCLPQIASHARKFAFAHLIDSLQPPGRFENVWQDSSTFQAPFQRIPALNS